MVINEAELIRMKEHLSEINDPRRVEWGNIRHKLVDMLIIALWTLPQEVHTAKQHFLNDTH